MSFFGGGGWVLKEIDQCHEIIRFFLILPLEVLSKLSRFKVLQTRIRGGGGGIIKNADKLMPGIR